MHDLLRIVRLLKPYWGRVLLALLLSVLTIGSGIALMMTSAWLISTAALQMGITSLGVAPTAVRLFGLSRALFRYLERLVSHDVTFRLLASLRVWFYARLEPLSLTQVQSFRSGDLMSRVVSDIDELQNIYLRLLGPPIVALIVTIGMGITFYFFDPRTAGVLVALMLASAVLLPLWAHWTSAHAGRQVVAERTQINTQLVDTIQGLADCIAFGDAPNLQAQLGEMNRRLSARERTIGALDGVQNGLGVLMVNLTAVAVLWVAAGRVDGVLLAALTLGAIAAFEAITPLGLAGQNLGKELAAAEEVFDVIETTPEIPEPAPPIRRLPPDPALSLTNVTFRYQDGLPAVYVDFSLDVPFGSHLLLTGDSGTGKSSLINMLLRFADYEAGRICVGGVDLRAIAHEDVRRTFGVMTQRTHLFNTTIRENIRIGDKAAPDAEVEAAAQTAQIHGFILSLPDGYSTYVGEGGVLLSGGERQRLALARMLLKDAPIWLLDEITANLDPITAVQVLDAVLAAGRGRTVVLMTHRVEMARRHAFDLEIELAEFSAGE